jgi:hypothetical protein
MGMRIKKLAVFTSRAISCKDKDSGEMNAGMEI